MGLDESEKQRRSFAYGNVALHNPAVTADDIDRAASLMDLHESLGLLLARRQALDEAISLLGAQIRARSGARGV